MMPRRDQGFTIGQRRIGGGAPAYLVAEIGINHNGDEALAIATIDAAQAAGADAVKFQNFRTADFVGDPSQTYTYARGGERVTETLGDMFSRVEMRPEMLATLAHHCRARRLDWHSTPTSVDGIEELLALDVALFKNGSDFLGHLPLIGQMARTGRPVVLSTGMARLSDIEDAVAAARAAGARDIVLLHCTSQYPAPAEEVHLSRIETLARAFGCPTGFSDHTEGFAAAVAAVALGAVWIEKHFTIDRALPGPDHVMSMDPVSFRAMVDAVRFVEAALGDPAIRLSAKEADARAAHRLSCAAGRDLPAGTRLTEADVAFVRPGSGVPPREASWLVGRRLTRPLAKGELIEPDALS